MENLLVGFAFLTGIIVISSIINEKKTHIPNEIALMIVSFVISAILIICGKYGVLNLNIFVINLFKNFKFDNFILECILGFIFFAAASKTHLNKFMKNIIPIGSIAIVSTIVNAFAYGGLFYLISILLNLNLNFWVCTLLGSLISLADSIPACEVLNKNGASKGITTVIEGETLFSDGICVAMFIFAKGMVTNATKHNLLILLFKEIFGAIVVGLVVSWILFKLLKMSNNPVLHILISLLTVSTSYVICEHFEFSGVIACVVAGMYFAYNRRKISRWLEVVDSKEMYDDFWEIVEMLLNSVLFVLVGLMALSINVSRELMILIPIAILINLIARFIGVSVATLFVGKTNIPGRYNLKEFVLILTWTGLRGGTSLAFIMTLKEVLPIETYEILFSMTMITILFTTIVQGLSTGKMYRFIEKRREKRIEESI
ncbi:MAG: cation:proton antiporter [Clostridia bacterium]|nr:cation:proton antiporter [Clostridia bacterium]